MPSKKQRRRREKDRRHEYEVVYVDEEGREVEPPPEAERAPRANGTAARPKAAAGKATRAPARGGRATRGGRTVDPPSWRRIGKRALIFAPLMFVTVSLLNREQTLAQHVVMTVFLLAFFLPFSYVMDSIMYRSFQKRTGGGGGRAR